MWSFDLIQVTHSVLTVLCQCKFQWDQEAYPMQSCLKWLLLFGTQAFESLCSQIVSWFYRVSYQLFEFVQGWIVAIYHGWTPSCYQSPVIEQGCPVQTKQHAQPRLFYTELLIDKINLLIFNVVQYQTPFSVHVRLGRCHSTWPFLRRAISCVGMPAWCVAQT